MPTILVKVLLGPVFYKIPSIVESGTLIEYDAQLDIANALHFIKIHTVIFDCTVNNKIYVMCTSCFIHCYYVTDK